MRKLEKGPHQINFKGPLFRLSVGPPMGLLPSIYLGRVCGNCGNEMIWRSDVTMMNLSASAAARQDVLKIIQHTLRYRYPNIISTNI